MKKVLLIVVSLVCFGVSGQKLKYKDKIPKLQSLKNIKNGSGKIMGPPPPPGAGYRIESKVLNVTRVQQKANMLCWAAAMEMIFRFHKVDTLKVNQVILAAEKTVIENDSCDCLNTAPTSSIDSSCFDDCNQVIGVQVGKTCKSDGSGISGAREFSYLFSEHEFDAIEDTQRMSWSKVKNQIDSNRPFLAVIFENWCKENTLPTPSGNHVVVVNGYCGRNKVNYLSVQDPWLNESALIRRIDFKLTDSSSYILSYVHSIHKSEELDCISKGVEVSNPDRSLCSIINNNTLLSEITFGGNISEKRYDKILKNDKIIDFVPHGRTVAEGFRNIFEIKTICLSKYSLNTTVDLDLSTFLNDTCRMTYSLFFERQLQVDLKKIDNTYVTTKICKPELSEVLLYKKEKIAIENSNGIFNLFIKDNEPNFKRVIYEPLNYEFYRFEYKDKFYLTPKKDYNLLKFKKSIAYEEKKVLSKLKTIN